MTPAALALNYWLHLLATICWLGGQAILALAVWPSVAGSALPKSEAQAVMDEVERRFRPIANLSLIVLLVTGVIQMGDDPHYDGFLVLDSPWAWGLLVKHGLIGGMILISAIAQGQALPALDRAKLMASKDPDRFVPQEAVIRQRLRLLSSLSLALGILVLLATAIITALP